ncbi:MAG: hypothetical protein ACT4QG_02035 [Sporichthyaceae bacterium]
MNRTLTAAALVLALVPGLAACGAGFEAETRLVKADNANDEINGILARNMVIVKGKQAPSAALAGTIINRSNKPDVLTTVTFTDVNPGATTISLSPNIQLQPGQLLPLGVGEFKPITIPDARAIKVGNFTNVVLTFKEAGQLRLQVETKDRTFFYEDITPEGAAPAGQAKQKIDTKAPADSAPTDKAPAAKTPAKEAPAAGEE